MTQTFATGYNSNFFEPPISLLKLSETISNTVFIFSSIFHGNTYTTQKYAVWAGGKNGSTDGWPPRPETRSNFIQSTRGGNSGGDEGKVEKRQRQRGGESRRKRTREREWEKQGTRMVVREREREQKLKKLRAKSTPIKVRAGRVLLLAPPCRPGPTRSAPRASALPHAPLLASNTPLARKLFQNFCEARYRFSIRFFSPPVPL